MKNIRNFVIIAHIDHGKSTLADRFLEMTHTIETRNMKAQYLDQLDLERERGITIKMAPVHMHHIVEGQKYVLNLIDTPGHSDFAYEVSRALAAVEGAILLVDATQGIQAQTLANLRAARALGLTIIGAINKVDIYKNDPAHVTKVLQEVAELLEVHEEEIMKVSGKTGEGVVNLLDIVVKKIPPPKPISAKISRALIFDSFYDNHKGVIASIRVCNGALRVGDNIVLVGTNTESKIKELGHLMPQLSSLGSTPLSEGDIGYCATGVRDPAKIKIGDTIAIISEFHMREEALRAPLHGYQEPRPVVFVSFYPDENDDYELLTKGLQKLRLNDSALTIEQDQNEVLGRGFKVGFLGRLHFEITSERLRREFHVATVNTFPSVAYRIKTSRGYETITSPEDLPQDYLEIWEPMVALTILVAPEYLPTLFPLQARFRFTNITTENFHDRAELKAHMPLAELVSDFDDQLKSITSGYASFSYERIDDVKADIVRVDIMVSGTNVPGLSRFFPRTSFEREARGTVERLKELLPRQQYAQPIQAMVEGRIIAREDIAAMRKDVTGYLYGGDRTRKMKLWKKQQRGKKRLKERSEAKLTPDIFKELLKR